MKGWLKAVNGCQPPPNYIRKPVSLLAGHHITFDILTCKSFGGKNHKPFQHVAQLTDISGPIILLQERYRAFIYILLCNTIIGANIFEKLVNQPRDIITPLIK